MTSRMRPKPKPKAGHWHHYNPDYPNYPYYWEWYELPADEEEEDTNYYRGAYKPKPNKLAPTPHHKSKALVAPHHMKSYYDVYDDMTTLEAYQCGFKDGFDTALMLVQNGTIPMPTPAPAPTPEPVTPPVGE